MKPLVVTPGDPLGVGAEVVCKAIATGGVPRLIVVGDASAMHRAARSAGLEVHKVGDLRPLATGVSVYEPKTAEPIEVAAIRVAAHAVQIGICRAMITGPIHKGRLAARGFHHAGHTGFLGELCGVEQPVMAFVGGSVRVALVTVHLSIRAVPDALTTDKIVHTARCAHEALQRDLGIASPQLAICGLNPHAGDDGLLGSEDATVVAPAVAQLIREGIDAQGPLSAEAAFVAARKDRFDLIVAMYHDQGLVPLKALDFGKTVNWTLGLPIVRTSVDHGTADDIAWTDRADPSSMISAIQWAHELTR